MTASVFFSWQSDTATREGRNFVRRALDQAVAKIATDVEVDQAVREGLAVDSDTQGVSGSPPITETILRKIDAAAVFVPDLTFCGKRWDGRPTPNPNVLIEYGWALKTMGYRRIVAVMNTAHGRPTADDMPFDLRHHRYPICYDLPVDADQERRTVERNKLAAALESALRAVFDSPDYKASLRPVLPPPPFPQKQPQNGLARFRKKGEAIGDADELLFLAHPNGRYTLMMTSLRYGCGSCRRPAPH